MSQKTWKIEEENEPDYSTRERFVSLPKDSPVRSIELSFPHPKETAFSGDIDLADFPEIWSRILLKSLKKTDFNLSEMFIKLLGLVSTLKWRGVFRKKAVFVSNPALHALAKQFPSLEINNRLVHSLNDNSKLLAEIESVRPLNIDVKLAFIPRISGNERGLNLARLEYIKDPHEIIWKLKVNLPLKENSRILFKSPRALKVIELMNVIAEIIVNVSEEQVTNRN